MQSVRTLSVFDSVRFGTTVTQGDKEQPVRFCEKARRTATDLVSAIIVSCRFQSTSMNTPVTGPTSGLAASLSTSRSSISTPCSISGVSLQALISKSGREGDEWTLQSGFDGDELFARPGIEFITVDAETMHRAEVSTARLMLGEEEYLKTKAQGRTMTVEQATAYALG
jgi:hypothetical protein